MKFTRIAKWIRTKFSKVRVPKRVVEDSFRLEAERHAEFERQHPGRAKFHVSAEMIARDERAARRAAKRDAEWEAAAPARKAARIARRNARMDRNLTA